MTCSAVVKVFSHPLSVSYVALLICFPSRMYNKGEENRSASVSIAISNIAKTPHLLVPTLYNFLVAACSLFLCLWRSEMNFRKQVFSLPDGYVVINFHMVPDKRFFHFVSIVADCFLKSCTGKSAFLSLGEWIGNLLVTAKGKLIVYLPNIEGRVRKQVLQIYLKLPS